MDLPWTVPWLGSGPCSVSPIDSSEPFYHAFKWSLVTAAFAASVLGQPAWIYPLPSGKAHDYTGNEIWYIGETKKLEWSVDWFKLSLAVWQDYNSNGLAATTGIFQNASGSKLAGTYNWVVDTYSMNLTLSPVFYFVLYDGATHASVNLQSHYFNIQQSSSTSSHSLSTSTARPSSCTSSVKTTTTATFTTTTPPSSTGTSIADISSTYTPSAGLSHAAIAGLSAGLGIPLLAAGLGLLWYLSRKRRRQKKLPRAELPDRKSASELQGFPPRAELKGQDYTPIAGLTDQDAQPIAELMHRNDTPLAELSAHTP
ncbi:hypothetical protein MMC13_005136 [Lambiella insularis]|nr:hypothetical protein [Lambiella insularis]